MGRIFRILGLVFVLLLVLGGALLYRALNTSGYFTAVASSFAGKCQAVTGVIGAEDIEADRYTGYLFVSSQDGRPENTPKGSVYKQGAIYAANFNTQAKPFSLTSGIRTPFHPHGISYLPSDEFPGTLAVVNHTPTGDEVMLFDVDYNGEREPFVKLTLRRTIRDPMMHSLNDVTLVSTDTFYATNDHGSLTGLGKFLETWLLLPRANVVYFDGKAAKIAATGFNYANGINRNAEASEIYVAETTGRNLSTFRRNATTGELAHIHDLFIPMGLDNIDVDGQGMLWIGAHPHLLDFLAHAQDATKHSPSAVVKVTPAGNSTAYETIYMNAGEELSGSSVAVHDEGRLIIGSVFEPHFLNCALN